MSNARNLTFLIFVALINGMIPILTGSTLFVWLKEQGLNLQTIGLYSLANLPIAASFIFSAILEYGAKRRLINYKYTLLINLAGCSILVYLLPKYIHQTQELFIICFILSICTTFIRIILLAVQKLLFSDDKLVTIINISTICFKIGLLIGGSLAFYLSQYYQWAQLYQFFAYFIAGIVVIIAWIANKNMLRAEINLVNSSLLEQIFEPFKNLFQLPNIGLIILLMFCYRAADNLITHYFDLFYLQFGLSKTKVAFGYKLYGMITASIGGILCIRLIKNKSYITNLQIALSLHIFSYVLIYGFSIFDAPTWAFYLCVTTEEFSRGMTMIIFWSFQTHICTRQHVLVQLALLTAIDSLSYSTLSAAAGSMIENLGYSNFILIVIASSIPALIILARLKSTCYNQNLTT